MLAKGPETSKSICFRYFLLSDASVGGQLMQGWRWLPKVQHIHESCRSTNCESIAIPVKSDRLPECPGLKGLGEPLSTRDDVPDVDSCAARRDTPAVWTEPNSARAIAIACVEQSRRRRNQP